MIISGFGGAHASAGVVRHGPAVSTAGDRSQAAAPRPTNDDEQLMGFLRNITRADAAEVLALTRPSKAEAQQADTAVVNAYGEF